MGLLIQLGIYTAIAAALAFGAHKAWEGVKTSISEPYVQAQIAADQKVVDEANRKQAFAEKQAAASQADIVACGAKLDTQTTLVKKWQAEAAQRLIDSQKAKAAAIVANADKNLAIAQFQKLAHAPPKVDQTCQQQLDAVTQSLRDGARARLPTVKPK